MIKEMSYFAFIGAMLFLMVAIQGMVSSDFINFMVILIFILFGIALIGIVDTTILRRIR